MRRCARNDVDIVSRSRDIFRPSFASLSLLKREGAGKTGCTLHPRSRVQLRTRKAHTSIQVQAEHPGLPCAMALRLTSCSSRRTALLPPSPALLIARLTPAPRRPNHTTSPYASGAYVYRALSVHRISPRVRDVRERPSIGRDGRSYAADLPENEGRIFLIPGLDGISEKPN